MLMGTKRTGLSEIKTSLKTKIPSRPKRAKTSSYLDLYLLAKEKSRIDQEKTMLDERMKRLQANLEQITDQMEKLKKEEEKSEKRNEVREKFPRSSLKTMNLDYGG